MKSITRICNEIYKKTKNNKSKIKTNGRTKKSKDNISLCIKQPNVPIYFGIYTITRKGRYIFIFDPFNIDVSKKINIYE